MGTRLSSLAMSTIQHTVRQGEYLSLIALDYGIAHWRDIYDHPDNAEFRRLRPDPNVIFPGDIVAVPALVEKEESRQTEQRHRFRVKGPRRSVRVYFRDLFNRELKNEPYRLKLQNQGWVEGETDGEGMVYLEISMSCRGGTIEIGGYRQAMLFSDLDPVTTVTGVQARLNNLGYSVMWVDGIYGPLTANGMAQFQRAEEANGLTVSSYGWPEQESLRRLAVVHDGVDTVGDEEITGRIIIQKPASTTTPQSADSEASSSGDGGVGEPGPTEQVDEDEPTPL
jgi:N-acetylmuramoyl-L-alanine amidase